MPFQNFVIKPGINKEVTEYTGQGQWVDGDNVRFFQGLPQKIGGWTRLIPQTIVGVARDTHSFVGLDGRKYLAIGTDKKLYIFVDDLLYDITPIRQTNTAVTNVFTTFANSSNVDVKIPDHGARKGDFVTFSDTTFSNASSDFDATTFTGEFEIKAVVNANTFTINTSTVTANGTVTTNDEGATSVANQGSTTAAFQITTGVDISTSGYGWGTDTWGSGQWGTPSNQLNLNGAFTTTTGSNVVTVNVDGLNASVSNGDAIEFNNTGNLSASTSFSTANFNDNIFTVSNVVQNVDGEVVTFDINQVGNEANAGITNTGTSILVYKIGSPVTLEARLWSLDNFGEDLIATPLNGSVYRWDTSQGVTERAAIVTSAPTRNRFSFVSTPDRHLVLFGSETDVGNSSSQDDLLIRFSSQEDINTYQPTAENTAGSLRIGDGSKIVGAVRSRGAILVWTDTSLHQMQFIGPPFTFGLRQLGQNCGLVGQHAGIDINGVAYWMSQNNFHVYDGAVRHLPCTVEQFVFDNLSLTASQNSFVGHNEEYNELMWFYATQANNQVDAMVAYNYLERTWWTGSLSRTTYIDKGDFPNPIGTKYYENLYGNTSTIYGLSSGASYIYDQEVGTDALDENGDPIALNSYIKSGVVDLGEGDQFTFIKRFIPDIQNQTGTVNMNFEFKSYPFDSNGVSKTFSFTDTSDKVDMRGRGRQFTANVISNTLGANWRLGTIRFDIQPDGMR